MPYFVTGNSASICRPGYNEEGKYARENTEMLGKCLFFINFTYTLVCQSDITLLASIQMDKENLSKSGKIVKQQQEYTVQF